MLKFKNQILLLFICILNSQLIFGANQAQNPDLPTAYIVAPFGLVAGAYLGAGDFRRSIYCACLANCIIQKAVPRNVNKEAYYAIFGTYAIIGLSTTLAVSPYINKKYTK